MTLGVGMKIRSGLTALVALNLFFGGATIASAQSSGSTEAALTPATSQQPQLSPLQQAIQSQLAQLPRKGKTQKARAAKIAEWYEARNFRIRYGQQAGHR